MSPNTIIHGLVTSSLAAALVAAVPGAGFAQAQTTPRTSTTPQVAVTDDDGPSLEDRIEYRLETNDITRKYDIDVDVDEGVVTLSGEVANERQKAQAIELAKIDGVVRIEDRIEVDPSADETLAERTRKGLNKAGDKISDAWITTKVNWFFVGEDVLDGSDINVDTVNNVVTLKGTVPSEAARARAKVLAERTEGVKSVKDELTIAPAR